MIPIYELLSTMLSDALTEKSKNIYTVVMILE